MESAYRQNMLKSFKKTIDDGFFPFIIVDAVFDRVKHFEEFWSYAKSKGFQVLYLFMHLWRNFLIFSSFVYFSMQGILQFYQPYGYLKRSNKNITLSVHWSCRKSQLCTDKILVCIEDDGLKVIQSKYVTLYNVRH